jgi:predicted acylesterase/phospholipase RssA
MNRIGLALSGGGFRASLYHLGLVRFLRDAGILPRVTHISSVSGGSVFAAHLVLNWDRYNGSPDDFDAAAAEFLAFVRLDVRNRIIRRYPLSLPLRAVRRLLGLSNRELTRTGLLEYHYERYLYGDTSLFELPERPELHILATNLSEGCLCSFNRDGLLMIHRQAGHAFRLDRIHIGLATVPMAITASSAFPGFFPPVELTAADVGANAGEFGRQAYTDGGVFDNLGVRIFGCLERPLLAETPLCADDFVDFQAVAETLCEAGRSSQETPIRRLGQLMITSCHRPDLLSPAHAQHSNGSDREYATKPGQVETQSHPPSFVRKGSNGNGEQVMLPILCGVLRHHHLQNDPLFAGLKPADPDAESLLCASRHGDRVLEAGDQVWLNRHLLESAFRQATGRPCFRRLNSALDGILVSDVGKRIAIRASQRAGGVIRTALRSTDIVMDRVWQLETDNFRDAPGFVFAPMTQIIESAEDPTALHPEIQRQVVGIRTDFDRFSPLEISALARHGYCVGRKACRAHPGLFEAEVPADAPWDPIPAPQATAAPVAVAMRGHGPSTEPVAATIEARTLQASAMRRIWSTLLDHRDWTSYIYVPLIIPILVVTPYLVVKFQRESHQVNVLVRSLSQGSRDLGQMTQLLESRPKPWIGEPAEEVRKFDEPDLTGFGILQDSRILDLRRWKPVQPGEKDHASLAFVYRRLKVLKQPENNGKTSFPIDILGVSPKTAVRFPAQQLKPRLSMTTVQGTTTAPKEYHWRASYDFHDVPAGDFVDLLVEYHSPGLYLQRGRNGTALVFPILADTAELTTWVLMPDGREYESFRIVRYETARPQQVEAVKVVTEYLAEDYTILAFKLLSLKAGHTYEVSWNYR